MRKKNRYQGGRRTRLAGRTTSSFSENLDRKLGRARHEVYEPPMALSNLVRRQTLRLLIADGQMQRDGEYHDIKQHEPSQ